MNLHETIDRFGSNTPRMKTAVITGVITVIAAVLFGAFWLGTRSGDGWASSRYIRERDENLKKIAKFEQNEKQLAAENSLLKKQSEAAAEILKQSDAKLKGDAANLTKLLEERNKRYEEIDVDTDYNAQLCGMCSDFARSGFPLSDATCGRCEAAPQTGSRP